MHSLDETLPVTIVTGFLGAGKTTLVNHWLGQIPRGDVAVIVNEHGEVGIDGELLAQRVQTLIEVTGGCVCCTTQGELVRALDAIATSDEKPKRILIETSGAASPAGVVRAVLACGRRQPLILDGVITVFDAHRVEQTLMHDLALEQLGYADVVVLSHADECTAETMAAVTSTLGKQNGAAVFVESSRGNVQSSSNSLDDVLALRRMGILMPLSAPQSSTAHVYESVAMMVEGEVDGERFSEFMECELGGIAGQIFRIKGIVAIRGIDMRVILQGVADSVEVTFGDPWGVERQSRVVVVGFGLNAAALNNGFEACAAGA